MGSLADFAPLFLGFNTYDRHTGFRVTISPAAGQDVVYNYRVLNVCVYVNPVSRTSQSCLFGVWIYLTRFSGVVDGAGCSGESDTDPSAPWCRFMTKLS